MLKIQPALLLLDIIAMTLRALVCGLALALSFIDVTAKELKSRNIVVSKLSKHETYTHHEEWAEIKNIVNNPENTPVGSNYQTEMSGKTKSSQVNPQIIGGTKATRGEFPWQVFVVQDDSWFCGGSLIHQEWVLTAAHCAKGIKYFEITLGASNFNTVESGRLILNSTTKFVHPNFNNTLGNDIALIKLPIAVNLTAYKFIQTIRLPKQSDTTKTFVDAVATVSGWGKTKDQGSIVAPLYSVTLPVISNAECVKTFRRKYVVSSTICTSGSGLKGTCNGDSGGPLVYKESDGMYTQIGIVSFGTSSCVKSKPSAYARVSSFLDWIASVSGIVRT